MRPLLIERQSTRKVESDPGKPNGVRLLSLVLAVGLNVCALLFGTVVVVALFFGKIHWLAEISTHFMHVYVPLAALLLCSGLTCKSRFVTATAALSLIGAAVMVAPYYFPDFRQASADCASFKIFHINVKVGNLKNYEPAADLAVKSNADLIAVSELDLALYNKLNKTLKDYPYHVTTTRCGGIGIFSKRPFKSSQIRFAGKQNGRPHIVATAMIGKREVMILAAHPYNPMMHRLKWRNEDYREWIDEITEVTNLNKPVILVGDLNCSAWSPFMRDFLEKVEMKDSALGFGVAPTWPADAIALAPIDQCLISKDFIVSERVVGPAYGSDHMPLTVTLKLPQPTAQRLCLSTATVCN